MKVNLSIDVPDLEAGLRFFGDVFGFQERARPFPQMAVLDGHNVTVCLHAKPAGTRPTPAEGAHRSYDRHWTPVHIDLHVEDFDGVLARATEHGAVVEQLFEGGEHPRTAFCADPFGHGFCLIESR